MYTVTTLQQLEMNMKMKLIIIVNMVIDCFRILKQMVAFIPIV